MGLGAQGAGEEGISASVELAYFLIKVFRERNTTHHSKCLCYIWVFPNVRNAQTLNRNARLRNEWVMVVTGSYFMPLSEPSFPPLGWFSFICCGQSLCTYFSSSQIPCFDWCGALAYSEFPRWLIAAVFRKRLLLLCTQMAAWPDVDFSPAPPVLWWR